jgi:hypothetical protein
MRRQFIGAIGIACCTLALGRVVNAQETVNQATISGRVLDPQAAAVPRDG